MEEHETFVVEVNSLEEARHIGSLRWSVDPSDIEIHVMDEGKRLFGILGKKMRIALTLRSRSPEETFPESYPFLEGLIKRMDLLVQPEVTGPNSIDLNGEDASIAVGGSGETLRAIEFLTNLAFRDEDRGRRIRIDSGGYKARRQKNIEKIALAAARESQRKGRPIRLEPMSSWERRIVHISLKERDDVSTCSIGSEPLRRVVVSPVRTDNQGKV